MSDQEASSQCQDIEVAGFVAKTFEILKSQEFSKIIYWSPSGRDFIIKDINKFQEIVLPKYFRHKKINSFIRQLNMYGFHKSRKDNAKSIFSHPNFLKDREDLLFTIKRKVKSIQFATKTPIKERAASPEKVLPVTAVKEMETSRKIAPEAQLPQIALRGFFESRDYMHSLLNLNTSLRKITMNELDQSEMSKLDDDKVSIELAIQQDRDNDFKDQKILNPSVFFSSWKQPA